MIRCTLMSERPRLASIECTQCSALIEVYPHSERDGPNLEWVTRDEQLCKSPPVIRCPYARAEVGRRFPGLLD